MRQLSIDYHRPDQSGDVLLDYLDQLGAGKNLPIQAVAYDCSNYITNVSYNTLMTIY